MYVNGFMVSIPEGREDNEGYVELEHGQDYSVKFINNTGRRGDMDLRIDGESVGVWRVEANQRAVISCPADNSVDGRFTFFASNSSEGLSAGSGGISRKDRGLVEAIFTPERQYVRPPYVVRDSPGVLGGYSGQSAKGGLVPMGPSFESAESNSRTLGIGGNAGQPVSQTYNSVQRQSGVTGLTGDRTQYFGSAAPIALDYERQISVTLRLVAVKREPAKPAVRPLHRRGNRVPDPV